MKNKKASHVGFAIAFIIFIGFLVFLFIILNPLIQIQEEKHLLLNDLEKKIINYTSGDLKIISVNLNNISQSCFNNVSITSQNFKTKKQGNLIKIYSSNEFPDAQCEETLQNPEIGLIRTEKYVFESKILKLKQESYKNLKEEFNIPNENNFLIEFTYSNKTEISIRQNEDSLNEVSSKEVFAKLIPVTYINQDAEIGIGHFRVLIW